MKRSEMIKLMQKAWKDYIFNVTDNFELGTKKGMRLVLDAMEEAGVRPPRRDSEEVAKEMGEVSSQAFYRSSSEREYEKRVNDWEPENEEK